MSRAENIRNNISDDYEKSAGYLLWDLSAAIGIEMDGQDNDMANIRAMFNVDNQTGETLERTIKQHKGMERKLATFAKGVLTITGNGVINTGDIFETENGVQFQAIAAAEIVETGTVEIEAIIEGNTGVVGANAITQMPVTLAGIVSCANEKATKDGYDAETDDSLRARYYTKLKTPDSGANKYAYRNWAIAVPGVGDADVYPLGHGDNTVDVVIIDTNKLPASEELVLTVQTYIDPESAGRGEGVAMMGAHCYVSAAAGMEINITGTIITSADQTEVTEAAKQSVIRYLAGIAYSGNNVSHARISNAIIETEGVLDLENLKVNGGTANIEVTERTVAILGTAVFNYA